MRIALLVLLLGCSSSPAPAPVATDAAVETTDDACPPAETVTQLGDTCVSFGAGAPCDVCGLPQYGYVCFNGRPDVPGCVRVRPESTVAGATYCCAELRCVRTPMLDAQCGAKKMVQCPDAAPDPAGCTKADVDPPYRWFCCE